jgi:hypothetical protein
MLSELSARRSVYSDNGSLQGADVTHDFAFDRRDSLPTVGWDLERCVNGKKSSDEPAAQGSHGCRLG